MRVVVAVFLLLGIGGGRAVAAPPPSVAITHSASSVPASGTSYSCGAGPYHEENSFYRVFELATLYDALVPLRITGVEIGIDEATDSGAGQPLDVNLYTITALPPALAGLTLVATTSVTVASQSLTTLLIPIDAVLPRDAILVVEVHVPSGVAGGNLFRMGSNSVGQTAPSYMRATACTIPQIEELAALGSPLTQWIMTVHGELDLPASPPMCTQDYARFENTTSVPLTDVGLTTSTIVVSGMEPYLLDVNLMTALQHTFAADMDVTLTSPQGTVVTITTDNGGGNDDVFDGTVWDDDANPNGAVPYTTNDGLVTDHGYTNGVAVPRLVPEEGLAAFMSEDPNGTWTLTVSDDLVIESGFLNGWGLELTAVAPNPQRVPTQFQNMTPVTVPTGPAVVTSTIEVSGSPTYVVDVSLETALAHTFAGDLDVTLTSPAGTVVTLTTDNGGTNDDVFSATGWSSIANLAGTLPYTNNEELPTDRLYTNGVAAPQLTPEESFGAFTGEDPNGTWTITISDDTATDGGELTSWNLYLHTLECAPTTTTTTTLEATTTLAPTTTTTAVGATTTTTTSVIATSTTIAPTASTTTTTLPDAGCARAATLASVHCRLAAMARQVGDDVPPPGRRKLSAFLTRADAAVGKAGGLGAGTPARARSIRKAARLVRKFDRKLGGGLGRAVPDGPRQALRDDAAGVLADLPSLE